MVRAMVHFCSGFERTIKDLALKVIAICGSDLTPIYINKRLGELVRSVGDNGKAMKQIGWQPTTPFEDTLRDTIKYITHTR